MSRTFVLITLIAQLILSGCGVTPAPATEAPAATEEPAKTEEPVFPEDEEPSTILAQQIEATGIIPIEYVDMSTAAGWPKEEGQPYEILGATTYESPPDKPETIIGVLYIREDGYAYPPNIYLVQYIDDTSIVLIDQNENTYEAEEVEPMAYEELNLESGKNHFLFVEGSLRCVKCPWWLFGKCYCYRCQ